MACCFVPRAVSDSETERHRVRFLFVTKSCIFFSTLFSGFMFSLTFRELLVCVFLFYCFVLLLVLIHLSTSKTQVIHLKWSQLETLVVILIEMHVKKSCLQGEFWGCIARGASGFHLIWWLNGLLNIVGSGVSFCCFVLYGFKKLSMMLQLLGIQSLI